MKVLLSIKPEFANKIFSGDKRYEYRRSIFKRTDIEKVIVYASAPVSAVIGEFEVGQILHDNLSELWNKTKNFSGISKEYFIKYFSEKNNGYAIEVSSFKRYDNPINIKLEYGMTPPQSFAYID